MVRCVRFTPILESLERQCGVPGLHFDGFGSSGAGLWIPLGVLSTGIAGSKLQVFFLSGTVRRVPFTSILGSLGVILVTVGSILAAFKAPGQASGPLWGIFGDGVRFPGLPATKG